MKNEGTASDKVQCQNGRGPVLVFFDMGKLVNAALVEKKPSEAIIP
jgi:hypothetical protein